MGTVLPAARRFDTIGHGYGLFAGALAITAVVALVAAEIVTCGLVTIFVVGAGVAMIGAGAQTKLELDDIPTGKLITGSGDVFINKRPAVRMYDLGVCMGMVLHPAPIAPSVVVEGAERVIANGKPLARSTMHLICGARIGVASPDVFVGGPTAQAFPGVQFLFADNIIMLLPFLGIALEAGVLAAIGAILQMTILNELVLKDIHDWLDRRYGVGTGDIVFGTILLGAGALGIRGGRPGRDIALDEKILLGRQKTPNSPGTSPIGDQRVLVGGHSPEILNNPNFRVLSEATNVDGTVTAKFQKVLQPASPGPPPVAEVLSKPKTSTLAPSNWSNADILRAGDQVAGTPPVMTRTGDGATLHRGTIDGIQWEVIRDATGQVTSSYPTGGNPTTTF